jgi:hypothetical protein
MAGNPILTPERMKTFQVLVWTAALITGVAVPLYKHYAAPEPFTATFHIDNVAPAPASSMPASRAKTTADTLDTARTPKEATALMTLAIRNTGSARHSASIEISHVKDFAAVGIKVTPRSTDADKWTTPTFREKDGVLEFAPIPELPSASSVELSIWGTFDDLFREVKIRSAEGTADVDEEQTLSGWSAAIAVNLWWICILICGGVGLAVLGLNERRTAG